MEKTLGQKIREYRLKRGITQEEFQNMKMIRLI